jgi:hypothetical protein
MCVSVFKTAGKQQENGIDKAGERQGMCESALIRHSAGCSGRVRTTCGEILHCCSLTAIMHS